MPVRRSSLGLAIALVVSLAACGRPRLLRDWRSPPANPSYRGQHDARGRARLDRGGASRRRRPGRRGSVAGHDVEFVGTDDACTIDGGSSAAEELIATDHLVAVVGPSLRRGPRIAARLRGGRHHAHLPALDEHRDDGSRDRDPFRTFLRTVFNDEIQGQQQAAFAEQELGAAARSSSTRRSGTGWPTRSGRRSAASSWATSGSRTRPTSPTSCRRSPRRIPTSCTTPASIRPASRSCRSSGTVGMPGRSSPATPCTTRR